MRKKAVEVSMRSSTGTVYLEADIPQPAIINCFL
jgi:hypothetical protein